MILLDALQQSEDQACYWGQNTQKTSILVEASQRMNHAYRSATQTVRILGQIRFKKVVLIGFLQIFVAIAACAQENVAKAPECIQEERFIRINGIDQWVTIKGNRTGPVVLFLHGGPGSPLSPYSDAIYKAWEKDFILVQWDQRGTARTFGSNAPDELTPQYLQTNPLTLEQMTADGIELSQYLLKHLGKRKLILFGSSWGSILGVKMAQERSNLFYAYIGHSQVVHPALSDFYAYNAVVGRAQESNDHATLEVLRQIGKPPYDTARNAGRFMRIIKKYQQKNTVPPPDSWFVLPQEYSNDKDERHRNDGDDYSFVNYVGDKRLGVASIASTVNFFEDGLTLRIPVFLIQGEEDLQTPVSINKSYFEMIEAPTKKFMLVPATAHGFNQPVVDTHYQIMKEYIVPAIDK